MTLQHPATLDSFHKATLANSPPRAARFLLDHGADAADPDIRSMEFSALAPVVRVADFAAGDGVTDDTGNVQAAIAEGGAGATIDFGQGDYFLTGGVQAISGQTWRADSAILRVNKSFMAGSISSSTQYWSDPINPIVEIGDGIDDVRLFGLAFAVDNAGGGGDLSKVQAIFVGNKNYYYSSQGTRKNIIIGGVDVRGGGLLASGVVGIFAAGRIVDSMFSETSHHAIRVPNSDGMMVSRNRFDHIAVNKSGTYEWPDDGATWGNSAAIRAYNVRNLVIDSNEIRATGGTSIHIRSWHGSPNTGFVRVVNNRLFACGHAGVEVQRGSSGYAGFADDIVVDNNEIHGIACAPDSTGHLAIQLGNKGSDTTDIRTRRMSVRGNVLDFAAPYEAFSYTTYDFADWAAGSGTHNARKRVRVGSNYASAVEVSDGGAVGGHDIHITDNECRHFPLAAVFLQRSRHAFIAGNRARWCGWGRHPDGYRWANASAFIAQESAYVQMLGNLVENHGAGANADDSVSPFKCQGSSVVLAGNIVDNRALGSANSGVNYWLYVLGAAAPGEFTLHNPETGANDTLAFSVYGRGNHVFDVPQGQSHTLAAGHVSAIDLDLASANVADPAGGATVDAECRAAVAAILDILAARGLMAT